MSSKLLENSIWFQKDNYTEYHTDGEDLITYEDAEQRCENLPPVEVFFHCSGMACTHNYPCPVCKTNHAVFLASDGRFDVCYSCREEGWYVGKKVEKNWFQKMFS